MSTADVIYVCTWGHVTPVNQDEDLLAGYHQRCRRIFGRADGARCGRPVVPLETDPPAHAAWLLGSEDAVTEIMIQRRLEARRHG